MPQLTFRALLMGGVIGMFMSAANLYTTLKIGWSFGVAITAVVISFVTWNLLRTLTGGRLSQMSVLENTCTAFSFVQRERFAKQKIYNLPTQIRQTMNG